MYKIQVKDNKTNCIWWEYGFSIFMMKRLNYLFNATYDNDDIPYEAYEIIQIRKIMLTWKTLKKCLTNTIEMC